MAMFPIFMIGLFAGMLLAYVYYRYIKSVPSKTKFELQERTIVTLREDVEALELANEDLRKRLKEKKK